MKYPAIRSIEGVLSGAATIQARVGGKWVPARSRGLPTIPNRFRAAWLVFTGRADALVWPGQ